MWEYRYLLIRFLDHNKIGKLKTGTFNKVVTCSDIIMLPKHYHINSSNNLRRPSGIQQLDFLIIQVPTQNSASSYLQRVNY